MHQEDLSSNPSDPSQVERMAEENARIRRPLFSRTLRSLGPSECFETVAHNGKNVVTFISEGSVTIDGTLSRSAGKAGHHVSMLGGWGNIQQVEKAGHR